jgi:hypothetical protein
MDAASHMLVGIRIFWGGENKIKTKTKKEEIDTIDQDVLGLIRHFKQMIAIHGKPDALFTDNGRLCFLLTKPLQNGAQLKESSMCCLTTALLW